MVDTPQKAAMDADIKYILDHVQNDIDTQRIFGNGADPDVLRARRGMEKLRQALTTLRDNQGCAVVTAEEFMEVMICGNQDALWFATKYPNGLRITKEK